MSRGVLLFVISYICWRRLYNLISRSRVSRHFVINYLLTLSSIKTQMYLGHYLKKQYIVSELNSWAHNAFSIRQTVLSFIVNFKQMLKKKIVKLITRKNVSRFFSLWLIFFLQITKLIIATLSVYYVVVTV